MAGTLIGRIGSGEWFLAGSHSQWVAGTSGRLFLLMNDLPGTYGDNGGTLTVTIEVYR